METYKKHSKIFLKALYGAMMTSGIVPFERLCEIHSIRCNDKNKSSDKDVNTKFSFPREVSSHDFLRTMKSLGFDLKRYKKHPILTNGEKTVAISYHGNNSVHINMVLKYIKEAGITKCEFLAKYNGYASN